MIVVTIMIFRALSLDSWMPIDVLAEEVQRDGAGDGDRTPGQPRPHDFADACRAASSAVMHGDVQVDFEEQAEDVLAGRDGADGAGEDVVEHQGGDGELGHELAQRLA